MTTRKHFEDILSICLDRVLKGESIEQCLASYPEYAKELEPLLRTAGAAKTASAIRPRAEFKTRARAEFQAALRDMETRQASRFSFGGWRWEWHSAWGIAVVAVLLVIATLGGTVAASAGSMPGSTLYPVKLATENVQMAFTFSNESKANLNAVLAAKRVDEIVDTASKGDVHQVEATVMRLNNNLAEISSLLGVKQNLMTAPATDSSTGKSAPTRQAAPPQLALMPETTVTAPIAKPAPGPAELTIPPNEGTYAGSAAPPSNVEQVPPISTSVKAANSGDVKQNIINNAQNQPARLEEALNQAPADKKPALEQTITDAVAEYERLIQALNAK